MKYRSCLILLAALIFFSCKKEDPALPLPPTQLPVQPNDNDHLLFGNPSRAAATADSFGNYLMKKTYYALSYHRDRGLPNWVSWHLYAGDRGSVSRQDDFRPDPSLSAGWYAVPSNAYSGSGFDRGHHVPSADRTRTVAANSETFLMTNMLPQAPFMNQETWADMEDSLRALVDKGHELYILMGSYGSGGLGNNGLAYTIHGGRVTVPSHAWKAALVIPNGNSDSSRVNTGTRLIAVMVPNRTDVSSSWKAYRTSVDAIEAATGYDLFDRLEDGLEAYLESRVDNK